MAVIGAEEQWPQIARIDGVRLFGAPWLPIPATPFPLPVRYHIYYGAPIPVPERYTADQANDPNVVSALAQEVQDTVDRLLQRGLSEREGVFT